MLLVIRKQGVLIQDLGCTVCGELGWDFKASAITCYLIQYSPIRTFVELRLGGLVVKRVNCF